MKKIGIVAGTRPEVIKMAMLYHNLGKSDTIKPIFISTAQHRQMLDKTLQIFGIKPDYDMDIMQEGQTLNGLTSRILMAWKDFYLKHSLDAILVQGDTTTVLSSAISAFYQKVPIGHIEAGLRTGNMNSPFPEEMNRRLTTPLVKWNFCPTMTSKENLLKENIDEQTCFIVGNTVIDSLLWIKKSFTENDFSKDYWTNFCNINEPFVKEYLLPNSRKKFILITGHRRENFGKGFENICEAIKKIVKTYPDIGVIYPVHLNPNVKEVVNRLLSGNERIALVEPLGYKDFVYLMSKAHFILSDSGGVQEEAPSLGKPVLVMRDTTERPESVEAGTCRLVGTDVDKILSEVDKLMDNSAYKARSSVQNPYGDGNSSIKIKEILEKNFI